jgi:hypothetical protein
MELHYKQDCVNVISLQLLIDKLYELQEKEAIYFYDIKHLDSLIEAVNDWPQYPSNLDEYLKQLYKILNTKVISISVVRDASKNLNAKMYGWEIESFSSLYWFMYMNSSQNLEELFKSLDECS